MNSTRSLPPVELLAELLQGYRRPAAATTDQNAEDTAADAKDWPTLAGCTAAWDSCRRPGARP